MHSYLTVPPPPVPESDSEAHPRKKFHAIKTIVGEVIIYFWESGPRTLPYESLALLV